MDTPSILRGFYYDTRYQRRCGMYHQCLLTKKCQNYDKNNPMCSHCETRCLPPKDLGGLTPEPVLGTDYQNSIKELEDITGRPYFTDPDHCETYDPIQVENSMHAYNARTAELKDYFIKNDVKMTYEDE